jgi:8-oxo-dGTP pyrophosphatase MutT (NUDIX family)
MSTRWTPHVTVAAVIAQADRFLLVEEHTAQGLQLNNPAGHLEAAETLVHACAREVLEETGYLFTPEQGVGIYLTRSSASVTYLRFAMCGTLGAHQPQRALDSGIVRTLWMTRDEVHASQARHRSPLVLQCIDDYLRGQRFDLNVLQADSDYAAL